MSRRTVSLVNILQQAGVFARQQTGPLQPFQNANIIRELKQLRVLARPGQGRVLHHKFNIDDTSGVLLEVERGRGLEGIRRGIESEHSLAEEKIFRVVPCNVSDPLVFDIAGDGVRLVPVHSSRANFDLFAVGVEQRTAWIQGDDALLVLDQNGNGSIDNGRELFGNFIGKSGYDEVATGFDKLALLDSDDNGVIDRHDAAFGDLRLWQDVDSDGQSQPSELHRLQTLGVSAIVLAAQRIYASDPQLTHRGQFVRPQTSMLETGSAMGSVYDAWFRYGRALPR